MTQSTRHRLAALAAAGTVGVLLAACGSSSGGSSSSAGSSATKPSLSSLKGQTITVTSWGGVWTDDEVKYLFTPFTADTGIKVKVVINGSDPAVPAILQEQQNNVSIDIAESLNPVVLLNKDYAQNFPAWLKAEFAQGFEPGSYTDNTVAAGDTATVIACNPAVMAKCPTNPQEFFDTKNFPGPRAIVNDPDEALPMALEADGVQGSQLFPLDIKRGIDKLKTIKSSVSVWPSSGSQQQQVLIDKQVGAEIMWNGRAFVVQQQNIPNLQISWNGALLPQPSGFVVLKHAPHAQAAFAYFSWMAAHPQNQAQWSAALTYPMPAKGLEKLVPAAVAAALPNGKQGVTKTDNKWFADNSKALEQAWQAFLG
jgi:putative spermidine/putrescine transport system substrate-binding protein